MNTEVRTDYYDQICKQSQKYCNRSQNQNVEEISEMIVKKS